MKALNIFLISIFFILEITLAKTNNFNVKKNEIIQKNDDYYIVIVNNTLSTSMLKKRNEELFELEDNNIQFELLIADEINNLIIENKDTYKNITEFEEIGNKTLTFEKRDKNTKYVRNYGESKHIYPIGSFKKKTIFLAFLSSKLVKMVNSLPYVLKCNYDMKFKPAAYYNENEILGETKWDNITVRNNATLHLSLISQGKFDPNLVNQYDTNYYYPSSAGKGIDIYIMDMSLNVKNQDEFPKTDERIVENKFNIIKGQAVYGDYKPEYDNFLKNPLYKSHGVNVAIMAGGLTFGVANKANIRAIHLDDYAVSNLISSLLNLMNDPLFKPNKSVFNMSFGAYNSINYLTDDSTQLFQEIVDYLSNEGSIFISSAGNDSKNVHTVNNGVEEYMLPCCLNSVTCVGGINNNNLNDITLEKEFTIESRSNYGECIDIYAPYRAISTYKTTDGEIKENKIIEGTSFGAPLVSGVVATILSEYPDEKFTSDSMLKYLREIGEKNCIKGIEKDDPSNVFINNGKHIVYSKDSIYNGCGIHAGNKGCPNNQCCSIDGKCSDKNSNVCKINNGCQLNCN
ncbi:subtilisin-like protein [Anaeromyces robustus]|uniref:Subtilisin-like protein n=1 Tax=Anaeromyces robustus TaxID=1754192 RepID=A0A1Y1XC10_9FUNG|nr:subtilisin-like protein [Anaeromyces robustus]|eukprot:ORX83265.1 subtilisin-like protein [Anaeromyces robustus]